MTTLLLAFTVLFPFGDALEPYECDASTGELTCLPHDAALPVPDCREVGNTGFGGKSAHRCELAGKTHHVFCKLDDPSDCDRYPGLWD